MIDRMTEKTIRLLLEQKEPITTSVIANEIGVSRSSIKHNLDYVKKTLQKAGVLLNSIPGKGVWLSADDHQRKAVLQLLQENSDHSSSYNYRKKYILDVLFEYNSSYTIQLFAEELNVARNVITKDLEVLEQWLLKFDLKIVKKRNMGIGVAGGEFNIRQAILENNKEFMNEIYGSEQVPEGMDYRISEKFYNYFLEMYDDFDILYLQELLKDVEDDLEMTFTDTDYWQLMEYVAVTLRRVRKGNVIVEKNIMNKLNVNNDQYTAAKNLFDTAIHGLQAYLGLEIRCMAAQFIVFSNHGLVDEINMEYFDAITREFLEHLKAIVANKRFVISEGLVHDVSLFIQKKKAQETFAISKRYDFRQDIKHRFPSLYGITLTTIEEVESCLKISFTDDDIAYIVMLINNAIDESDHPVNAVFISAADFHTSKYQANKIMRNVENLAISKILHYEDIKESSITKFELIITTVPLELKKNVLLVSREISDDDLEKISRAITEKQNVEVADRDEAFQLFDPKLILCDVNAKRKEDVISRGCQLLYEKGYVKKGFEKKIWEREKTTPTSIGNSIAVPHGYKTYVKKSGIVVMRLKRPMNWTYEDRIEIVFLMAIDFNTQSEVYNFFQQFYAFIDDRSNIKALKNARDEMEIWEILQQSGITA